jgi:amino acid adenylation domain-containing protein
LAEKSLFRNLFFNKRGVPPFVEDMISIKPCIHQCFEAQAIERPDAVAVSCDEKSLTYRELNERANQLAHHLKEIGVGPEIPVALCLDRSLEMLIAILGVLKAGGAYVPVDLAYPKDRLAFMLDDTRAPVLLTQNHLRASLPEHSAKVICLDSDWESISKSPARNPETETSGDNVAYIIFTSGSTGKPKGCLVTHSNVVRLFTQTERWYQFSENDVWTLFHSYAFDFSVWEIWGALFYGGKLIVVPYLTSRSPVAFYELLAAEKVTVLNQTPSAFRQLIWAENSAERKKQLHLRYVIFGGEALELQSLRPWFAEHGDQHPLLVNMYGITETTVHVTYRPIKLADVNSGVGSVIGVPIPDLQLYVLDKNLKPVPPCTPGEMFVGGAGVARGYLNRPELTSERFINNPFSNGGKLYRTGDLAQFLSNGELEYLGRIDHQIKIRGFRIELGEIEAALNQHPGVRESVVVAHQGSEPDKRLVAYLAPKKQNPSVTDLRDFLSQKIPQYMIPSIFIFLESLPLTPNGKVDRKALPSPDSARPNVQSKFVAPRNDVEKALASIWSQVLEIDSIGIHDNFFELGGDSIRSIAVLSRAQESGIDLSLQQLFQNPTIEALALCSGSSNRRATFKASAPFSLISAEDRAKILVDVEDAYPMIQLQTGMFYYNELNPASAVYHDVFSFAIGAKFDREKLEQAVRQLVQRHPVLRTSFHIAGFSTPMQLVHREVNVPFSVEDLRGLDTAMQEKKLVDWIEVEKRNPFDRTRAPLIRFHTQLQSENAFQFIISFHHVYLDGWSLAALMTEIFEDYAALMDGSGKTISPPKIAYREFVALELDTVASEATRKFWSDKIQDATVQNLPRWPKEMRTGGHEQVRGPEIVFAPEILENLKRVAQTAGVPLKTVLLAAHQRVMGMLYGQSDVMSGLVCNGRPEEVDGEKLIGLFLNTLPIRQQLAGGTWIDLVKQTFAAEQEIIPHRRFPLAEIQKMNGGQPLFEAAFDFVHFHVYKNLQGYEGMGFMEGHYFEANNLTLLTTFMLDVTSTQLQMHFDYDPNLLCREQIETMCGHYANTLKAMAAEPNKRYDIFSPLSPGEKNQILTEWNATDESYPREKCIHQLFEAQVEKTPDAIAVIFEHEKLTYRDLNFRAEKIADDLRRMEIAPETLVGVFVERSVEMVAGLLGVLKAGGTYVPLDPAYPGERLAQMISDSQMPVILTQKNLASELPSSSAKVLILDNDRVAPAAGGCESNTEFTPAQDRHYRSENLAYVIYTSGSTGKPKGVQISHRAVVNLLASIASTTGFNPKDNLLAVTTFSFDIAALEIFMPLITGATLTIANRDVAADGLRLSAMLDSTGATVMQATPATWRLLLEAGWKGNPNLKIFCGGEALTRSLADELLKRSAEVWNLYGPTETTIWSAAWKVVPETLISIGRALANTQFYILDKNLQPVPVGVAGELHIGGDGLARGYFNRTELTTEKFIRVPSVSEKPIYKTGDLARYLPDGNVECLGRTDHQVKIRGFRIELGDIESALRKNPGINEALVMAREDVPGDKRLVAYLATQNANALAVSSLRDFLKTTLPDYMVPSAYIFLEKFPLTPSGKIDRKALPAPEQTRPDLGKQFYAPLTPLETDIAKIWSDVFHLDQIGRNDNFFELGGHSLIAIQIIARIRKKLGVELALPAIFKAPTVARLAEIILETLLAETGERELQWLDQLSDEEARQLVSENA